MIWCLGMYASGSTWVFNAARAAAQAVLPGADVRGAYAENARTILALTSAPDALYVVKTHRLDAKATRLLNTRARRILLTIRDPRDAVLSMMLHMDMNFSQALKLTEDAALYMERFRNDPRAVLLRFEAGFTDRPAVFDTLAAAFGGRLDAAARHRLFAESRRDVIEAKIARLEELPTTVSDPRSGDAVDMDTQWHRHHAHRTGEVGRWRRMMPAEAQRKINARLGGWMMANGYE